MFPFAGDNASFEPDPSGDDVREPQQQMVSSPRSSHDSDSFVLNFHSSEDMSLDSECNAIYRNGGETNVW